MTLQALLCSTLLFTVSSTLSVAAPVDDYLKEKQRASAQVEGAASRGLSQDADRLDEQARQKLQASLRKVIASHHLKGFPQEGELALVTLLKGEEGSGGLDGLAYRTADGKRQLVVTLQPLLNAWLKTYRQHAALPGDLAAVMSTGTYYGGVINDGAAAYKYADIPVKAAKPGSQAKAILFKQGQDEVAPAAPDRLGVTVIQGERVYVLWEKVKAPGIAWCRNAYKPGRSKEGSFQQCYARNLPKTNGYRTLSKRAQAIVDELSAAQ